MPKLKDAVRAANVGGLGVFKPGYPTGRNVYMVLDRYRDQAVFALERRGYTALRVPCGHDYNYGGDLYRIIKTEDLRAMANRRA